MHGPVYHSVGAASRVAVDAHIWVNLLVVNIKELRGDGRNNRSLPSARRNAANLDPAIRSVPMARELYSPLPQITCWPPALLDGVGDTTA